MLNDSINRVVTSFCLVMKILGLSYIFVFLICHILCASPLNVYFVLVLNTEKQLTDKRVSSQESQLTRESV